MRGRLERANVTRESFPFLYLRNLTFFKRVEWWHWLRTQWLSRGSLTHSGTPNEIEISLRYFFRLLSPRNIAVLRQATERVIDHWLEETIVNLFIFQRNPSPVAGSWSLMFFIQFASTRRGLEFLPGMPGHAPKGGASRFIKKNMHGRSSRTRKCREYEILP